MIIRIKLCIVRKSYNKLLSNITTFCYLNENNKFVDYLMSKFRFAASVNLL